MPIIWWKHIKSSCRDFLVYFAVHLIYVNIPLRRGEGYHTYSLIVEEEPFVSQWAISIEKVPLFPIRRKKIIKKSSSSPFLFLLKITTIFKATIECKTIELKIVTKFKTSFLKTTTNENKHQNSNQIVQYNSNTRIWNNIIQKGKEGRIHQFYLNWNRKIQMHHWMSQICK